jgi:hypothetical protein
MNGLRTQLVLAAQDKLAALTDEALLAFVLGNTQSPKPKMGRPLGSKNVAPSAPKKRRAVNIDEAIDAVLEALKGNAEGLRSEELQRATGFDKDVVAKAAALALEKNLARKTGERRATRYFANLPKKVAPVEVNEPYQEEIVKPKKAKANGQVEMPIPPPPKGNPPTVIRRKKAGKA